MVSEEEFLAGLHPLVEGLDFSSSNVDVIIYEPAAQTMVVQYRTHGPYTYPGVSLDTARELFQAASKGTKIWDTGHFGQGPWRKGEGPG